jgi:hypothetical protein
MSGTSIEVSDTPAQDPAYRPTTYLTPLANGNRLHGSATLVQAA